MSDETIQAQVRRLDLHPGDLVAVQAALRLPAEQVQLMLDQLRAVLPEGVRAVVFDGGMTIDDEMVDRAVEAFWAEDKYEHSLQETREAMRDALIAAMRSASDVRRKR